MGMVMRSDVAHLAVGIEFDVSAEDVADGTTLEEVSNPLGACPICVGIVDDQASGQKKIAGEEQSGLAIVVRDMGRVMSRGGITSTIRSPRSS